MKFKYKDIEISKQPELNIKAINDHKKSFIENNNIKIFNGVETKIYPDIISDEIILIPETIEEEQLLAKDIISTVANNTSLYVSNSNPTITSNIESPLLNESIIYINKVTGELFTCIDNSINQNVWVGQNGTIVKPTGISTINDGLIMYFNMENMVGSKLYSSNNIYGTMTNCKLVAGKIGNALSFKGNTYITLEKTNFDLTKQLDINFWLYPDSFNSRQNIMSKSFSSEFSVVLERDGTISFLFGNSATEGTGQYNMFRTITPIVLSNWTHISIQRVAHNIVNIYFNNQLVQQIVPRIVTDVIVNSAYNIYLGTGYAGGLYGTLDDVYFHNRNITVDERTYLYNKGVI